MRTSPSSLFLTSPWTLHLTSTCWSISHQTTQRTVNTPSWSELTAELTEQTNLPSSMHFIFYLARDSLSALFTTYLYWYWILILEKMQLTQDKIILLSECQNIFILYIYYLLQRLGIKCSLRWTKSTNYTAEAAF